MVHRYYKNKQATTAPTSTDDGSQGYSIGSQWIDTTNDRVYECVDASTNNAVWQETGGESNTASNVGVGGVGIYSDKTASNLEFKSINVGSSKITITNDPTNNEIDIDLGTVNIEDLSNVSGTATSGQVLSYTGGSWSPSSSTSLTYTQNTQAMAQDDSVTLTHGAIDTEGQFHINILEEETGTVDANTVLLIHSDSTNNSTSFEDSTSTGHTVSPNGDVKHSTDQAKFGATSILLDGTGDYLSVPDHTDFDFSSDFTFECWVRFNVVPTTEWPIFVTQDYGSGSDRSFQWRYNGVDVGMQLTLFYGSNYSAWTKSWSPSTDTWYHVAVVKSSSTIYFFVDGASIGQETWAETLNNSDQDFNIGSYHGAASYELDGYIDEVRLSTSARWTSTFTPQTSAYAQGKYISKAIGTDFKVERLSSTQTKVTKLHAGESASVIVTISK